MLNVLIVDDEPLIRNRMKTLINWEAEGFRVLGVACDGRQALDFVCEVDCLDIIITDLKMPRMDGLELIKNVLMLKPQVKFIVLSAFDDFHMVKKAYTLGVKEYLLKTEMTSTIILEAVKMIATAIFEERANQESQKEKEQEVREKVESFQKVLSQNHITIKESYLKNVVWGDRQFAVFPSVNTTGGLRLDISYVDMQFMAIQINDYVKLESSDDWNGDKELLIYAISNVITETLDHFNIGDAFHNYGNEWIIILSLKHIKSGKRRLDLVYDIYLMIYDNINKRFSATISAGISSILSGETHMKLLYEQAVMACKYNFVGGKGRLFYFGHLPTESHKIDLGISERVNVLKERLKLITLDDLPDLYTRLSIRGNITLSCVDDVKRLFERYYFHILDYAEQQGLQEQLCEKLNEYENTLRNFGDLRTLNAWLKETLLELSKLSGKSLSLVSKVKAYIHKHYSSSLSLELLASYFNVNHTYLSRAFKKEAKCGLVDYIAKIRIEAAIMLMDTTDLKLYEISERVGFISPEHFSRTLKKTTGRSATEFRK